VTDDRLINILYGSEQGRVMCDDYVDVILTPLVMHGMRVVRVSHSSRADFAGESRRTAPRDDDSPRHWSALINSPVYPI